MAIFALDVASYQGPLSPSDVVRAGFSVVNLKISHGTTQKAVHPDIAVWVARARSLGLGISTFHYLDGSTTGVAQAAYAYERLRVLGLLYGTAHQVDCESTATESIFREYTASMQLMLQRPIALYTGDWFWRPKGWDGAAATPYLWAAPNAGYLTAYPGDASPHWSAGYGGWPTLSIMQYAVEPLRFPDGSRGTIEVSKSAIRDTAVWRDLTLGRSGMTYAPEKLKEARTFYIDTIKAAGYDIDPLSVGIVGDDSHGKTGTSYHLGKDALKPDAYSIVESSRDRKGLTNAASAIDYGWFSITVNGRTYDLRHYSRWLVAQCEADAADVKFIREVIYSPDGEVVKRWDRLGIRTTGDASHLTHTHESHFRDTEDQDKTAHLRRYFTEIGVLGMTKDEVLALMKSADGQAAMGRAAGTGVHNQTLGKSDVTIGQALQAMSSVPATLAALRAEDAGRDAALQAAVDGLSKIVNTLLSMVTTGSGSVDSGAIMAKLDEVKTAAVAAAAEAGEKAKTDVLTFVRAAARAEADALNGQ